jgi:type 1 glutamine amidotransferase
MRIPSNHFSRRAFLGGAAVAGSGVLRLASAQQAGARRVLALIGDRYHNSDYIKVALTKIFDSVKVTIDYTIDCTQLSRRVLKDYQVFLCLRDGMIWPGGYLGPDAYTGYEANLENRGDFAAPKSQEWLTEEQAGAVKDFVSEGNGFYAVHNSSHVSLSSKTFRDVMGGAYIGHPALRPFKVRVVNANHPITKGIGDFMVNDEQHYVHYDKDPKSVLLEAENIDGLTFQDLGVKSIAGWAYDYGKGRVVFTSPGHTIHALWAPEYVKIQQRSMEWLLKEI